MTHYRKWELEVGQSKSFDFIPIPFGLERKLQNSHPVQQLLCWAPDVHRSLWPCRKMLPLAQCWPSLSKVCRWSWTLFHHGKLHLKQPYSSHTPRLQIGAEVLNNRSDIIRLPFCACDVVHMQKGTGLQRCHDSGFYFLSFRRLFEEFCKLSCRAGPTCDHPAGGAGTLKVLSSTAGNFKLKLLAEHSRYKSILGLQVGSSGSWEIVWRFLSLANGCTTKLAF